jgi:1-acyl-sn-glycerol-3-phosphate acyltransferase
MEKYNLTNTDYLTKLRIIRSSSGLIPLLIFYCRFFGVVLRASRKAQKGVYSDSEWSKSSFEVLNLLEHMGVRFTVTGVDHLQKIAGPCVIIGNHMSIMETLVLPFFVQPIKKMTFIIKESLLRYPVFKHIMRSRNPIAVTRTNPRLDLKIVMEEGLEKLGQGISIIVFPQTTRSISFDPEQMSSIGIKLAKKANVPIIPLALQTSAWNNGKFIKDFGDIDPSIAARFAFGEPIFVKGKGAEEHQMVIDFIEKKLKEWKNGRNGH